ncbi:tyrosine-type recombinase/integrase [Methyloraptor flagellatus]|uniref:Integrase arm-type DNA-binding domain-containing protein n=1 Tax=Methyloraptor flagellatus TaxID=3162530 RepID=A0AAU7XA07_9HYPH
MAAKLLTAREVAAIKADGRHSIGDGLYLELVGNARRWFTRYTIQGRRREMQLGSAADVSLKEARELVADVRKAVRAGVDPIERRNAVEVEDAKTPSFGTFADELIGTIASGFRNEKHIYQWKQTLGDAYCASIRKKAVDAITTEDVVDILKPLWTTKQETASRLRGRIEKVLDAAKARGWRTGENPAQWRGHLDHLLPRRQKLQRGHQPAMPYDKVPAFISRLRGRDAVAARALEFLILTAARTGEVIGATWSEIDLGMKVWTVPADRMKAGREHRVPLSGRTVEILNEVVKLREREEPTAHLFPSSLRGQPLSNMAFKQLLVRMGETGFVPHGFRSSFRDWCGECTPFPREVAEAALAHIIGNSVEQAYRRGDALEKRREMMEAWAIYVGGTNAVHRGN